MRARDRQRINDSFGDSPTHAAFSPVVFTIFDRWADLAGRGNGRRGNGHDGDHDDRGHGHAEEARASITRGQALFITHPITISGVSGHQQDHGRDRPGDRPGRAMIDGKWRNEFPRAGGVLEIPAGLLHEPASRNWLPWDGQAMAPRVIWLVRHIG